MCFCPFRPDLCSSHLPNRFRFHWPKYFRSDETTTTSVQDSVKKHKKSVVVLSDGFVTDRIKTLKQIITGSKCEDNEWTNMLRANEMEFQTKNSFQLCDTKSQSLYTKRSLFMSSCTFWKHWLCSPVDDGTWSLHTLFCRWPVVSRTGPISLYFLHRSYIPSECFPHFWRCDSHGNVPEFFWRSLRRVLHGINLSLFRLLHPLTRCDYLPLLCRSDRFYLISFPKLESRFEQLCLSLVRSSLKSIFHQTLCPPPSHCISDRLTPSVFLPLMSGSVVVLIYETCRSVCPLTVVSCLHQCFALGKMKIYEEWRLENLLVSTQNKVLFMWTVFILRLTGTMYIIVTVPME
jgi:hypothetical protein